MFSQLVDIPNLFRRLDTLPRELATARQELWAVNVQVNEAERDFDQAVMENGAAVKEAHGALLVWEEEWVACKDILANLNDEMFALRMTVDLITALGHQETVSYRVPPHMVEEVLERLRNVPTLTKE